MLRKKKNLGQSDLSPPSPLLPKKGIKLKVAYYEAKRDLHIPKIQIWVVV